MIGKEPKALPKGETVDDGCPCASAYCGCEPSSFYPITFEALAESAQKCKRGVGWKDTVSYFILNWVRECMKLEEELMSGTYKERTPKFFTIREPKPREIVSISFRDRVYQRSLNDNIIYPAITRSLIRNNFACQRGKGTLMARNAMREMLRHHYRKFGTNGFAVKCDVKGYYPNMSHEEAKKCLARYIDGEALERACRILDTYPSEVGYNPGSQILQLVGISMLDPLDHCIKERLRIKGYIRYMDDFILLTKSRAEAEMCLEAIHEQLSAIGMELNAKKTKVISLTDAIRFLGFDFRLTPTGKVVTTIAPEKLKSERRKLKKLVNLVKLGTKTRAEVDRHYRDWCVHASYGNNTLSLRRMDKFYNDLWR